MRRLFALFAALALLLVGFTPRQLTMEHEVAITDQPSDLPEGSDEDTDESALDDLELEEDWAVVSHTLPIPALRVAGIIHETVASCLDATARRLDDPPRS
jgi:hypothetical protein